MGIIASLPQLSLEEVEKHNTRGSCWIVRGKKVYDVTRHVSEHPGGEKALLSKGGGASDCAGDFKFHSTAGQAEWKQFAVGELSPEAQRKFKIKITDVKNKKKILDAAIDAARPAYTPRCQKVRRTNSGLPGNIAQAHRRAMQRAESGSNLGESCERNPSFGSMVSEGGSLYSTPPPSQRGNSPASAHEDSSTVVVGGGATKERLLSPTSLSGELFPSGSFSSSAALGSAKLAKGDSFTQSGASSPTARQQQKKVRSQTPGEGKAGGASATHRSSGSSQEDLDSTILVRPGLATNASHMPHEGLCQCSQWCGQCSDPRLAPPRASPLSANLEVKTANAIDVEHSFGSVVSRSSRTVDDDVVCACAPDAW